MILENTVLCPPLRMARNSHRAAGELDGSRHGSSPPRLYWRMFLKRQSRLI